MQEIHIQNILVRPIIGVYPHERLAPQDIYLDIIVTFTRSELKDDVATTFDYDLMVKALVEVAEREQPQLIETMAEFMTEECLQFPGVTKVILTLHKPAALKNGRVSIRTSKEKTQL